MQSFNLLTERKCVTVVSSRMFFVLFWLFILLMSFVLAFG